MSSKFIAATAPFLESLPPGFHRDTLFPRVYRLVDSCSSNPLYMLDTPPYSGFYTPFFVGSALLGHTHTQPDQHTQTQPDQHTPTQPNNSKK